LESWKNAFRLVRLEFNYSKRHFLIQIGLILILLYLIVPTLPNYFENSFFSIDFLFICTVTIFPQLAIPKVFKVQNLGNGLWASHFIILLNQLAVRKETIVKYRFIMYNIITLSFTSLFLISLYLLSPYMQQNVSVSTYIVFSFFWLCLTIYVGCIQTVYEAGSNLILNIIVSFLFIGPLLFITVIYLFYIVYSGGFVQWTLMASSRWPVVTSVCSLVLAIISFNFWMHRMKLKMKKIDYFS